jgi:hypothetical protein
LILIFLNQRIWAFRYYPKNDRQSDYEDKYNVCPEHDSP